MGATPVIPALRQKDLKFDASPGYTASARLQKQNNNKLARTLKGQPKAAGVSALSSPAPGEHSKHRELVPKRSPQRDPANPGRLLLPCLTLWASVIFLKTGATFLF